MARFVTSLRENPELAIFLTLAIGFVIGRLRIGSFKLGNVVGTLLGACSGRRAHCPRRCSPLCCASRA